MSYNAATLESNYLNDVIWSTRTCSELQPSHVFFRLTEYVNAKLLVYRTKESVNKLNKPPSYEKCNRYRKKNHTAKLKF